MAVPPDQKASIRLVVRQVSELLLARGARWWAMVPREQLSGLVFEVVLSASIAHRPLREPGSGAWVGLEEAGVSGRPVNGTAVAQSMRLPHTTVRRRAAGLVAAGLFVRDPVGFSVAARVFADGALARVVAEDTDDLVRTLRVLTSAGYRPAADALAAFDAGLPPGVAERLLLAFAVRVMETSTEMYRDVATGAIMAAIVAANVRHVTDDAALARRYAEEDTLPPDAVRNPVTIRALARALDAPFETVRRRVAGLVADGLIVWKDKGVIVPTDVLRDDRHTENNRRIVLHFEQMLDALVALNAGRSVRHAGGAIPISLETGLRVHAKT